MHPPSPGDQPYGLALPSRRANVTVTRRTSIHSDDEGGDSVGPLSRDSLEGTRRYYGVSSSPNPEAQGTPRQRTISATNSPRPLSATHSDQSYSLRSPPRSQAPLPVPRGFLAPQKPAAARRLEQRERTTTVSTTGRVSLDIRPSQSETSPGGAKGASSPLSLQMGPYPNPHHAGSGTAAPSGSAPVGLGISTSTTNTPQPSTASPPATPQRVRALPNPIHTPTRPGDSVHGHEPHWDRGTDTSSPSGGVHPELSSDHLVDVFGHEKQPSGTVRSSVPLMNGKAKPKAKSSFQRVEPKPYGFTKTRIRKYKVLENKQTTFFLGGKLMTGGDSPWSFMGSCIILFGISGVWIGTTGVWIWKHGHEYGMVKGGGIAVVVCFIYIFGLVVSSLIAASLREPGILPRDLDPDPPYTPVDAYWEANPREIIVGKDGKDRIQVKYCETCKSYRPPRCSHCRLCGNCVEGIDHHCGYLHACVGRRNYFSFLVFLVSITIGVIYIVVFSAVHFSMLCHHDHVSFGHALRNSPGAAVSFLLGVIVLPPICFMLYYHIRLLLFNLTTIEQIRASASSNLFRATQRPYNPFAADSFWRNVIIASIGRPQFPSWIDASGYVIQDNRRVNPALTTPEKYLELV